MTKTIVFTCITFTCVYENHCIDFDFDAESKFATCSENSLYALATI